LNRHLGSSFVDQEPRRQAHPRKWREILLADIDPVLPGDGKESLDGALVDASIKTRQR
jgi:hypothetical protein